MKKSFIFILVLCLTQKAFQYENVRWVPELSTSPTATWSWRSKAHHKIALVFPQDHAYYLFIAVNDYTYEGVRHPDNTYGWICELYPEQKFPYECQVVNSPLDNNRYMRLAGVNRGISQTIIPGEPVIFQIDSLASGFTDSVSHYFYLIDDRDRLGDGKVQDITTPDGEMFTHYRTIINTCPTTPCSSEGLEQSVLVVDDCGLGCVRTTKCDMNKRYYQDVFSYSICGSHAQWPDNCHSCPRVYEVDEIPPRRVDVVNGTSVNLNAILFFNENPSGHLKAVWDIRKGQEDYVRVFECSLSSSTLLECESISSSWTNRLSDKYSMAISYPKVMNFKITINDLTSDDSGTQVRFSLVDPENAEVQIYATTLMI